MMVGNDRGDAAFDAVSAANPNFSKLSSAEQSKMKSFFEVMFSADTVYLTENMDVLPAAHSGESLSNPAGQAVSVTGGPGAPGTGQTSSPEPIEGKGSVQ